MSAGCERIFSVRLEEPSDGVGTAVGIRRFFWFVIQGSLATLLNGPLKEGIVAINWGKRKKGTTILFILKEVCGLPQVRGNKKSR